MFQMYSYLVICKQTSKAKPNHSMRNYPPAKISFLCCFKISWKRERKREKERGGNNFLKVILQVGLINRYKSPETQRQLKQETTGKCMPRSSVELQVWKQTNKQQKRGKVQYELVIVFGMCNNEDELRRALNSIVLAEMYRERQGSDGNSCGYCY